MLHLKQLLLWSHWWIECNKGRWGWSFFFSSWQDLVLACMKDNESVTDRHVATALIKKAALKPKYSAFTAQSSPGSLSVQSSAVWFFLLSHRFIIQLSSKTHVKLNINRTEDPLVGPEQLTSTVGSCIMLHRQPWDSQPGFHLDKGDAARQAHLVNTFWFGGWDCREPGCQVWGGWGADGLVDEPGRDILA